MSRKPQQGGRGSGGGGFGPRGIGRPVEKAKDFKGTVKRLVRYMGHHKWSLFIVFLATLLSTLFSVLSPKILGRRRQYCLLGCLGDWKAYQVQVSILQRLHGSSNVRYCIRV